MKLNKWIKVACIVLPVIAVTACSTDNRRDDSYGVNDDTQTSSTDAQRDAVLQELQKSNLVYFDFDKYNIKSDFAEFLNHHAAFLRANPEYHVIIEGHADERGTPEYNIALGERRANAVKMYLQGRGVSGDQISIVSYGKEKPAVLGHNESAYAQNRRAVIVY